MKHLNIWKVIYKSFNDVSIKGNSLNSKRWVKSVLGKSNPVRNKIGDSFNQSVFPVIVSMIPKDEISIFDFGGGMDADFTIRMCM